MLMIFSTFFKRALIPLLRLELSLYGTFLMVNKIWIWIFRAILNNKFTINSLQGEVKTSKMIPKALIEKVRPRLRNKRFFSLWVRGNILSTSQLYEAYPIPFHQSLLIFFIYHLFISLFTNNLFRCLEIGERRDNAVWSVREERLYNAISNPTLYGLTVCLLLWNPRTNW